MVGVWRARIWWEGGVSFSFVVFFVVLGGVLVVDIVINRKVDGKGK